MKGASIRRRGGAPIGTGVGVERGVAGTGGAGAGAAAGVTIDTGAGVGVSVGGAGVSAAGVVCAERVAAPHAPMNANNRERPKRCLMVSGEV
jgi:hypothetical protein